MSLFRRITSIFSPANRWTTPAGTSYGLFDSVLSQPHVLIAGTTGSGKSVFMDGLIREMLFRPPGDAPGYTECILIDPKGTELYKYAKLPHTIRYCWKEDDYINTLEYAVGLMEKRFAISRRKGDRLYNGSNVYLFIDEWADIKTTVGKKAVPLLQRLCQKGRASRIHVVLATQHCSVKILPEEVRCNFDCRIALKTTTKATSRIIIGESGAEMLQRGFCIFHTPDRVMEGKAFNHVVVPWIKDAQLEEFVNWWLRQK